MKFVKKFVACMLVLLLFSSSVMLYVEAAEAAKEIENQSSRTQVLVTVEKEGISAWFRFAYVDGSSVELDYWDSTGGKPTITKNVFSGGDTRIVEAYVIRDARRITFGAWCDIYGQTGSF